MESWLKQAEEECHIKEQHERKRHHRFQEWKASIRENYAIHQDDYDVFLKQFKDMVIRVNALPFEKRSSFGKLRYRPKTTKLENHLHIISGSRKIERKSWLSFLPGKRKSRIKHIRVAYLSVSKQLHHFSLELKESMLEKRELKKEERGKRPYRRRSEKRTDLVFCIPFSNWSDDRGYEIIDWLSFQKEMESIDLGQYRCRDIGNHPTHRG